MDSTGYSEEKRMGEISDALNRLEVPKELRLLNRRCIEHAFETAANGKKAWYQRRVSVPLPAAAGFLLFLGLQILLSSLYLADRLRGEAAVIADGGIHTQSTGLLNNTDEPVIVEQGTYIAGIGFVEKSKRYVYAMENEYETN